MVKDGAEVEAGDAAERRVPEEELPPLDPEEIRKRLEHTERQFRNRRKILIRGLLPFLNLQFLLCRYCNNTYPIALL